METTENLFQVFSQIFIQSQQSFNKCDVELRTKCRTLSEKLNKLVEELERDAFTADLTIISTLEEDTLHILRSASEIESRRDMIKESVRSLQDSTQAKISRRK
jgi:Txe/YoeB family toxin of Txe-Axe toxin-antitoxin module